MDVFRDLAVPDGAAAALHDLSEARD